ncbi:MAG: HD domain-containing protein [Planctomycetes bacterium]|nr:HD domain-containing protein [Planctomycetota bacterium]
MPQRYLFAESHVTLRTCDREQFALWSRRRQEIADIAGPLLESPAFRRLGEITFLGILSPRFAPFAHSPLFARTSKHIGACDGSRASHSLGVALIALDVARSLGCSPIVQRYAVAWGLVHDIATWPLSHTGEFAFSRLTGTSTSELRRKMVLGASQLPSTLHIKRPLAEIGVDSDRLLALFAKQPESLESDELYHFAAIVASPLTPDALEGIWRSGLVFGVHVPSPEKTRRAFQSLLFGPSLPPGSSGSVLTFWRRKSTIYRSFINRPTVMRWESAWSLAIGDAFPNISLVDSLHLQEESIVERVLSRGIPEPKSIEISRYKPPLEYLVRPRRRRSLSLETDLRHLQRILVTSPITQAPGHGQ